MDQFNTTQASAPDSLVLNIVERVAKREGVKPTELTPPLQEVVDVDALEILFASQRTSVERNDGRVSFRYCGYDVTVHAEGDVEVDDSAGTRNDAITRSA